MANFWSGNATSCEEVDIVEGGGEERKERGSEREPTTTLTLTPHLRRIVGVMREFPGTSSERPPALPAAGCSLLRSDCLTDGRTDGRTEAGTDEVGTEAYTNHD